MKKLAGILGLVLALVLLTGCGGGGGGGGGSVGGGSASSAGKSTYSGDFSVGGKSYNTLVMDGNENSGKISLCGTNGFLDGTYTKQTTNAAAVINGTFTVTFDNGESITITLSDSNISFSNGSINAGGSATVNGEIVVTEYIIATALNNGIQFIIRKPDHPSFANGFGQIFFSPGGLQVTVNAPNENYVSFLYPLVNAGEKYSFYYQIDGDFSYIPYDGNFHTNGDIEITAKGGLGEVVPRGFNWDNTTTVVTYESGRPHVHITGGTIPSFPEMRNIGVWACFFAMRSSSVNWGTDSDDGSDKWLADYYADNNDYSDINPDSNWINMFNANYKNAYRQGYEYIHVQYGFRCEISNLPAGYSNGQWRITGQNFKERITLGRAASINDIP
ncbi:MAG: hypothetical protein IKK38_10515 [Spirochaetaceae bacterium]|nr:hypothetical protein [Spirochaetaceae bacterium]